MKGRDFILLAGGILGGWWFAGSSIASSAMATWRHSAPGGNGREFSDAMPARDGLPHREDGQIIVSEGRLKELMAMELSPTLKSGDFTGEAYKGHLDQLASWVGLDTNSKEKLAHLLRDAGSAHLAWEKQNARVSKEAPGKWVIEIPGDGGRSKGKLLTALREAFGPEQAESLILAGDMEHFFHLPPALGTDSGQAGKIEVEVARFTGGLSNDETYYFRYNGNMAWIQSEEDYRTGPTGRLKHLLPSYARLGEEARAVPVAEGHSESDPFANPFDQ